VYTVISPTEHIDTIARRYLPQVTYMRLGELVAAMREVNGGKKDDYFRKGTRVIIPGLEATPIAEHPRAATKETEFRGIYLTGYTAGSDKGLDLVKRWHDAGGNAVVFDIKDFDGWVNVPFENPLAPPRRPLISNLRKYARYLHSLDMHVIARIALFRDAWQAQNHSQLAVRSRRTGRPWLENGKLAWMDPSSPEVQNYDLALARTVALSGVDEVQFDYVRFPAEGDQNDAAFYFQSRRPNWQRSDVISNFLDRAYSELHPLGVLVSLDVFGVMAWQRPVDLSHTGQDIPQMARHCDILSPMIYPSHFFGMDGYAVPGNAPSHFIGQSLERFQTITTGTGVVIRPWLQAFAWKTPIYSPAYVKTQVAAAHGQYAIGFLFWNARNDYSEVFPADVASGKIPDPSQLIADRGAPPVRKKPAAVQSVRSRAVSHRTPESPKVGGVAGRTGL
jgi:hypothetical protein